MQLPTSLHSKLPSMHMPSGISIGRRRSGADVVGLDIQPGFAAAVRSKVNGSIVAEQATWVALPSDTMRDGEVVDEGALADALREMFAASGMNKRVRVGVANQRTVLRTLELPPVTDQKELAAAVTFQAQDQVPMPLSNAVLDFHPLGIVDTPAGPRQRVVLVAAQRDMIERLVGAVRRAGLSPEGVDLSAFALIRSLYRPVAEQEGSPSRVLYLNVDGLTNLAIAEGSVCRFTRVVGSGLEGMAVELAERRAIALTEARELIAAVDLTELAPTPAPSAPEPVGDEPSEEPSAELDYEDDAELEEQLIAGPTSDIDVRAIIESGIRDISGEVRNSLDFHRSQDEGGEVSHAILSGAAQDIPGFAQGLQSALGVEVRSSSVGLADERVTDELSAHRLAVAAGLSTTECPQ
jgi:type IV pilus assembly protein PilM